MSRTKAIIATLHKTYKEFCKFAISRDRIVNPAVMSVIKKLKKELA